VKKDLRLKGFTLPISERPCVMGVLNITPDSFSDGGMFFDADAAVRKAEELEAEGADIIDVGGESSRPGAKRISVREELKRVLPVIKALRDSIKIPISIDTCKSEVAREALSAGAAIVNDISALNNDPDMARAVAEFDAGLVLMHMKGVPETMQNSPVYADIMQEIKEYLSVSIDKAIEAGVDPERIIIDPGIGFGKTLAHNLIILKELNELRSLGKAILVGTSRKSFIGTLTGRDASGRIFGTAASIAAAVMNGADIVRVHDVSQMREVTEVAAAISRA
jgi:dihydropteroate synthase